MKCSLQICIVFVLFLQINVIFCDGAGSCTLSNSTEIKKGVLQSLSPLQGKRYEVEKDGITYTVGICVNASERYANASVLKTKGETEVLAYYNDTDIIAGDTWLLLTYGNNIRGVNATRVQIMIMCNEETDNHPLHFLESWIASREHIYAFELHSTLLCKKQGLSNGSVFCIIFLTSLGLYLLIGIAYRRIIGGAKGLEQIPHYDFWRELGNLQADGCNFMCRRDIQREESWRRLTNNFNDPHDDAMLRP